MVRRAHGLSWRGRPLHPYLLMSDAAMLAVPLLAVAYHAVVPSFSLWAFALAYAGTQVVYQVLYLRLKHRLLGERARSYLQDTVLVVLPAYLGISAAAGVPLVAAADFAALSLSVVLACMRLGCFFGGCCYGVPARWGVYYPQALLRRVDSWRRFTPGPFPGARVLPTQLFEALFNVGLFAALSARLHAMGGPDGRALPLYLAAYAGYRFVAEFFRGHRHRPRRGRLSESQWACLIVGAACGAGLVAW